MKVSPFRIREAKQKDAFGMAKVRVDTWRATYRGIVPEAFLANLSYQNTAHRWKNTWWEDRAPGVGVYVAESGARQIVGIAVCGPEQSHDPDYPAEVYVLYVLPAYQSQGIGRRLVAACVKHLLEKLVAKRMLIWVLAENPYRKFYESLGGKLVREKTKEIGGRLLSEVGYGWEDIHQLLYQISGMPGSAY